MNILNIQLRRRIIKIYYVTNLWYIMILLLLSEIGQSSWISEKRKIQ